MYKAVKEALTLFHKDGYIHGNLWETNIIVKRDGVDSKVLGNIILVDFGWTGKENTIWYLFNIILNYPDILYSMDIKHGGLISSAHNDQMLEFLS